MSVFRVERGTPLTVQEAWRRVTDWPAHARRVPLTAITVRTPGPTCVGTVFVARTGVGRARFDDPMEVVRWEPPAHEGAGHCRLAKRGRVITGWAEIEVTRVGGRTVVRWTEELRIRPLPRSLDAVTGRVGRIVFGRVVSGLLGGPGR